MKLIIKSTIEALIIAAALAGLTGCTDKKPEIDYSLIGGTVQVTDSGYNVDIRHDPDETTVNSDTVSGSESAEPEMLPDTTETAEDTYSVDKSSPDSKPAAAKPETAAPKPAVTISTDKPAVTSPAQTVRTDLPKVTAEPQYTTKAATTTKPAQTEPEEIETDKDGFPANPTENQVYVDSTGQEYIFDSLFGWIKGNDGNANLQEFPDNYGEIGSGKQVLH
ncbi:MAG: hypothetical protein ACI4WS_12780 [Oscillospiraceae bacterium]